MALGALVYFIGSNVYLWAGSRFNPANVSPLAAATVLLCSFPLGFARTTILIYTAFWLVQLGTSFYWPSVISYVTAGLAGNELSRRISQFQRSAMAALMIGPPIAGFLYSWNSTANFIMVNLSYFSVVLSFFMIMRYFGRESSTEGDSHYHVQAVVMEPLVLDEAGKAEEMLQNKNSNLLRYRGWACNLCGAICMGIFANIIPIHIRDGLGFTETSAGMVQFFRCGAGFAGFAILGRFTAWHFKGWWFVFIQGGFTFCSLLFLLAGNHLFFFFFLAILFGLLNSACNATSVFYSSSTGKHHKRNVAFHEIYLSLGLAIGSAGGGFVYQRLNLPGMALALSLALSVGVVVFVIINRRKLSATTVLAPQDEV